MDNYTKTQCHIDEIMFDQLSLECMCYADMIDNWCQGAALYKRLVSTAAEYWRISLFDDFDRTLIETISAAGGDFRYLAAHTKYIPCWIVFKALKAEHQLLRIMSGQGFIKPPHDSHSSLELPSLPAWMCDAVLSLKPRSSLAVYAKELSRICPVETNEQTNLKEYCPRCSILG